MDHYATSLSDLDERPTRAMKAAGNVATELGLRVIAYEWAPFIGNLVRVTYDTKHRHITRHYHVDRWGRVSDTDESGILGGRDHLDTCRFTGYVDGVRYLADRRERGLQS